MALDLFFRQRGMGRHGWIDQESNPFDVDGIEADGFVVSLVTNGRVIDLSRLTDEQRKRVLSDPNIYQVTTT
jgi:hypothetical protein